MAELDPDDVDSITEGTYVYWMDESESIPRGSLGEVLEVDGATRKVKFPNEITSVDASKLQASDFQKSTFVHLAKKGDMDEIGEVKKLILDEGSPGKLLVNFHGEDYKEKPKNLIKCSLQAGMFVFWCKTDEDIPQGHAGEVLHDLNEKGKVKVQFPNGKWKFRPRDLVLCNVQPGSYVRWSESDEDIEAGELGKATGEINDSGKVKVAFAKGTWSFKPDTLIPFDIQLGAFVRWDKGDEDVKKKDLGQVVGIKVADGSLRVQFPAGRWKFRPEELTLCRIQPGHLVTWVRWDEDIGRGDIGEVVRLDDNKLSIQWPQLHWSMRTDEVEKFRFQKGDRVQWTKSDDDIPQGHMGYVMSVYYDEDDSGKTTGNRLNVKWPNGRWNMKPYSLLPLNFDVDGANQLKLSFKRFDKNGDGKLSEEELVGVLSHLGGEGGAGLAPEECKQLFKALDRDSNGKLTVDEFLDYVFSDASAAARMVLADGFGLDAFFGFPEEGPDVVSDDDEPKMKSMAFEGFEEMKSSVPPEAAGGIDGDTEVSRTEWATAMLNVGVPRAAALTCFDEVLRELGGNGDALRLKDLAGELNGLGGAAGIEELRAPIGQVKNGEVRVIDLNTPSEDVRLERDLAQKTGIDGLMYHLFCHNQSLKDAAAHLPEAMLSELERKVLSEMGAGQLVERVLSAWECSHTLSAVASWQRARESCKREVQEIIKQCKAHGTKFTDDSFNPLKNEKEVLYVDKEHLCSPKELFSPMGVPTAWKRATDIDDPYLVSGAGASSTEVVQGKLHNSFFLSALAALAGRKCFLRQAVVAYDVEVGVYGVMFCEEMHFTYVIVDDYLAMASADSLLYAKSSNPKELWVSILEKAYCKHLSCVEMCDTGWGPEAVFSFVGGIWDGYYRNHTSSKTLGMFQPQTLWEKVSKKLENGEIMTTLFKQPCKGRFSGHSTSERGPFGLTPAVCGLLADSSYAVLGTGQVEGHKLIRLRNPWPSREWTGPWCDGSRQWTEEAKAQLNAEAEKQDGAFWMENVDYVDLAVRLRMNRPFGPTWQCAVQYGTFGHPSPNICMAVRDVRGGKYEISFKRGDKIELPEHDHNMGDYRHGKHLASGEEGYFRTIHVDYGIHDTYKYELTLSNVLHDSQVIVALMQQNVKKMRMHRWLPNNEPGQNSYVIEYPCFTVKIQDSRGQEQLFYGKGRAGHAILNPSNGPFKVYVCCNSTDFRRFALYAFAPQGELQWKQLECDRDQWIAEVGASNNVNLMRDRVYNNSAFALGSYITLGEALLHAHPMVGGAILATAGTIKDIITTNPVDAAGRVMSVAADVATSDEAAELAGHVGSMAQYGAALGCRVGYHMMFG